MADLSTVFSHPFRSYGSQVHATNRYTELSNFPAKRLWKWLTTRDVPCSASVRLAMAFARKGFSAF